MGVGPQVSVKAALRSGDKWVLLRNERDEWELPGGRIEPGDETLQDVVRRECLEELGCVVEVGALIDSWLFEVVPGRHVVIVCYAAAVSADAPLVVSDEHQALGVFGTHELATLHWPARYRTCWESSTTASSRSVSMDTA